MDPSNQTTETRNVPRCPQCGYDFAGLPRHHHCPECGFAYDDDTMLLVEGRGRTVLPGAQFLIPISQMILWMSVTTKQIPLIMLATLIVLLVFGAMIAFRWRQRQLGMSRQLFACPEGFIIHRGPGPFVLRSWDGVTHLQFARHFRWKLSRTKPIPPAYRIALLDHAPLIPGGETTSIPDAPAAHRSMFHFPQEFYFDSDPAFATSVHRTLRTMWLDAHAMEPEQADVTSTKFRRVRD